MQYMKSAITNQKPIGKIKISIKYFFRVQWLLPPKFCVYVDVKFVNIPDFNVVINPYHDIQGLLSPNCDTEKDQNVILFKNPTDKYITVRKNADVGTTMQLDVTEQKFECWFSKNFIQYIIKAMTYNIGKIH